jgi:hypothetical protein
MDKNLRSHYFLGTFSWRPPHQLWRLYSLTLYLSISVNSPALLAHCQCSSFLGFLRQEFRTPQICCFTWNVLECFAPVCQCPTHSSRLPLLSLTFPWLHPLLPPQLKESHFLIAKIIFYTYSRSAGAISGPCLSSRKPGLTHSRSFNAYWTELNCILSQRMLSVLYLKQRKVWRGILQSHSLKTKGIWALERKYIVTG